MSSFKIDIQNLPAVQKQIQGIAKNVEDLVRTQMTGFATDVVRDAKALAPTNDGFLRNAISFAHIIEDKGLSIEFIVAADYAAYVEFGTRSFAEAYVSTLPPDWQTFAETFRGPGGGTFAQLVERLTRWVRLKGISAEYEYVRKTPKRLGSKKQQQSEDLQAAYAIAVSILRKGIKKHPFLYPAIQHNKELLVERLQKLFGQ